MNPVGAKIWEMLKKQYPPDQIAAALEQEFQVPRVQIEQDIAEFLEHLKTRKLIRTGDERTEKRSWISRLLFRRSFS
jgi:coenzyme PQQ synthesis protein D (PqqD)